MSLEELDPMHLRDTCSINCCSYSFAHIDQMLIFVRGA